MTECVRKIAAKKFCKYDEYRLLDQLVLLLILCMSQPSAVESDFQFPTLKVDALPLDPMAKYTYSKCML